MNIRVKKILYSFMAVIVLANSVGCSSVDVSTAPESTELTLVGLSVSSAPEGRADEYYPNTAPVEWLDGGETLAVPDGTTIRYLGLDNKVKKTVELPQEYIIGECRYFFTSNRIFLRGGHEPETHPGYLTACLLDGVWELTDGAILDGDGKLLRAFPRYINKEMEDGTRRVELSDGRALPAEGPEHSYIELLDWVTDDLVVLNGLNRLFFYRLSTDTLTLVDDMSDWMQKYGKMAGYFGVVDTFPYREGAFYFASKNEEKWNTVGTVWYADETGTKELFDGQEFTSLTANEKMLLMVADKGETEGQSEAYIYYARTDDLVLHELDRDIGWVTPASSLNGSLVVLKATSRTQPSTTKSYILDVDSGSLELFSSPQAEQECTVTGIKREGKGFQCIYTVTDVATDAQSYYRYHYSTGVAEQLDCAPLLYADQSYHPSLEYYIEYSPGLADAHELRIRPLE